jgi:hypothetical protein
MIPNIPKSRPSRKVGSFHILFTLFLPFLLFSVDIFNTICLHNIYSMYVFCVVHRPFSQQVLDVQRCIELYRKYYIYFLLTHLFRDSQIWWVVVVTIYVWKQLRTICAGVHTFVMFVSIPILTNQKYVGSQVLKEKGCRNVLQKMPRLILTSVCHYQHSIARTFHPKRILRSVWLVHLLHLV